MVDYFSGNVFVNGFGMKKKWIRAFTVPVATAIGMAITSLIYRQNLFLKDDIWVWILVLVIGWVVGFGIEVWKDRK